MLVATILLCAAVGFGLGSLVQATLALTMVGGAVGFVLGMALVVVSFRDR